MVQPVLSGGSVEEFFFVAVFRLKFIRDLIPMDRLLVEDNLCFTGLPLRSFGHLSALVQLFDQLILAACFQAQDVGCPSNGHTLVDFAGSRHVAADLPVQVAALLMMAPGLHRFDYSRLVVEIQPESILLCFIILFLLLQTALDFNSVMLILHPLFNKLVEDLPVDRAGAGVLCQLFGCSNEFLRCHA